MGFFDRFLGGESMTYDYRWLRVVGPGSNTGAHYDVVYMGRGTHNLYTCWTPLGDVPYELGPLALLVGSHRFERVKETYGNMDVDRDHVTGWFSNDPIELVDTFGGQWRTSEFRAGDVLIFGMFTMHASINNTSNRFRLSSDTRYQLKGEPVDDRWIGRKPKAHYAWTKGQTVTMEEARAKWGV
jgi:ectoine hydroxylase-related dioxygenase (phytanoyl-CoA dioxygenase family)